MKKTLLLLTFLVANICFAQTGLLTPVDRLKIKTPQELSGNTQVITRSTSTGETGYVAKTDLIDYIEVDTASALPTTGIVGKIYCAKDDNKLYRWNGTIYTILSSVTIPTLQTVTESGATTNVPVSISTVSESESALSVSNTGITPAISVGGSDFGISAYAGNTGIQSSGDIGIESNGTSTGLVVNGTNNYGITSYSENGIAGNFGIGGANNNNIAQFINGSDIKSYVTYDGKVKGTDATESDQFVTLGQLSSAAPTHTLQETTEAGATTNVDVTFTGDVQVPTIPATANSATSKNYIDNALTGITWKNAVKVASTGNLSLSGTSNVDGTTIPSGTRILVKNQTDTTQNGIYVSASGSWTRAADADSNDEIETSTVAVLNGTVNKNTQWTCTSVGVDLGVTAINYGQISGAGTYTSSYPIDLSANVFSLNTAYANSLAPKANPTFTGSVVVPNATLSTQAVNLGQLNTAAKWTETSANIRNTNAGNIELKLNSGKLVSILNNSNTEVARFAEDGQLQILGSGGIFGNGSGCRTLFTNNAFTFSSYATGLTRYVFDPIYLFNTSGTTDVIGFSNQTVNPTSGTGVFNFLNLSPTIYQTGGASGITRGIYINPTLTSAADFRALEITGGKVVLPTTNVDVIKKTNGSGNYAVEDGTTLYHTTAWFTPTGTFSSTGTSVTTTGGQLTASMVGSKIGVGTDKRTITAFLTSNTCTVDSAFSTNYVSQASGTWGVYSRSQYMNGTFLTFLTEIGTASLKMIGNSAYALTNGIEITNNAGFYNNGLFLKSDYQFKFSSTTSPFGTADLGFSRNSAGVFEINNGTAGTFRDLRVRNVISPRPVYANDAAADADSSLPSGATYRITGSRQIFEKP